jgi:hypothetical protein
MEGYVKDFVINIKPGEMQVHENLAIVPLYMKGNGDRRRAEIQPVADKVSIGLSNGGGGGYGSTRRRQSMYFFGFMVEAAGNFSTRR